MRSIKSPSWTDRLLGLGRRLVPPRVFAVESSRLSFLEVERSADGDRVRHVREVPLPDGTFFDGPLGGPCREPAQLKTAIEQAMTDATPGHASLVLPDDWLRLLFTEIDQLPKGNGLRDEAIAWKLRRLVPFRVEELRIRAQEVPPLPIQEEPKRLLLGFGIELLLSQLEEAFSELGVRLGSILNESLAVAAGLAGDSGIVPPDPQQSRLVLQVLAKESSYALFVLANGEPLLYRYKSFGRDLSQAVVGGLVTRELALTRSFLQEQLAAAGLEIVLAAPDEAVPAWTQWLMQAMESPVKVFERSLLTLEGPVTAVSWPTMASLWGALRVEVGFA